MARDETTASEACLAVILTGLFGAVIGGFCIDYSAEFWLRYFGHPTAIPFYASAIAGIFLLRIAVVVAVLTWLASFAL